MPVVMLSPLIEWSYLEELDNNPVALALHFPSFAAASLQQHNAFDIGKAEDAYRFALGEYLTTMVGPPLEGDAAKAFGRFPQGLGKRALILSNSGGPGVLCAATAPAWRRARS